MLPQVDLQNMELTMCAYRFIGEDPVFVFDFLTRVVEDDDTLRLSEGQLNVCLPHPLNKNAAYHFVNNDIFFHQNIIPNVYVLQANIAQRFGFNTYTLQLFLLSSYDDEVNELADKYLIEPELNARQVHYSCHVLLLSEIFDHYTYSSSDFLIDIFAKNG